MPTRPRFSGETSESPRPDRTNAGVIRQRHGLGPSDPTVLASIERACGQIISAAQSLAQVFPGDNTFRDQAKRATTICQKANRTRFTSY